jgi:TonB family protein
LFVQPRFRLLAEAAHKTDAELTRALIGTWEIVPVRVGVSKRFITFNADGTSKATAITTNDRRHPPGRVENEGTWRVKQGYLIREITKLTPPFHNVQASLKARLQIELIENGTVKLRAEKVSTDEMHRVAQLPTLPPLITSKMWAAEPELSTVEFRKVAISTPQPVYPIEARQKRIEGSGMFNLTLAKDGKIASIQVLKSTGSKILDDAAETTLRQWRLKPGILEPVRVPINFSLTTHTRTRSNVHVYESGNRQADQMKLFHF